MNLMTMYAGTCIPKVTKNIFKTRAKTLVLRRTNL